MESFNESSKGSQPLDIFTIEVPLFATYLKMLLVLVMMILIVTPAVIVVCIIKKTEALHTNYYFLVANLLVTDIIFLIYKLVTDYLIMIVYLLDLNTDTVGEVLFWLSVPLTLTLFTLTNLLYITLAIERVVVFGFPYRHRNIMTTKVVRDMVVSTWVVSAILAAATTALVPHHILWPFGATTTTEHSKRIAIQGPIRVIAAAFIIATNAFLYYKVHQSNKKAKENMRTGSSGEEETKRLNKLVQKLRSHMKPTISLLLLGGIEAIISLLLPITHMNIGALGPAGELYVSQFFLYTIHSCIRLSHSLVYGLYMKQIRQRLPNYNISSCPKYPRRSKVIVLNQQQ